MEPTPPDSRFSPPPAYFVLLRKAIEAGFTPTEIQKKWLTENRGPLEQQYESNDS